jgi:hypothetical protein
MSIGYWKSCTFCIFDHFCSSCAGFHQCLLFRCRKETKDWINIWICIVYVLYFDMMRMWGQRFLGSCYSLKGFLFHKFCCLICLIYSVCNVDPNLSLVASTILEALSFANPYIPNVSSFIILIIDPTFSLATSTISKAFYFVSFTVEPTLSFVSLTYSWTILAISLIFCYTIPKKLIVFCFNYSKMEPFMKKSCSLQLGCLIII